MGRNRKRYTDDKKIIIAKEALRSKGNDTEIAVKNGISPSTLSDRKEALLTGGLRTEKEKELLARNADRDGKKVPIFEQCRLLQVARSHY
jgi:transposase-like protein